MQQQQPRKRGPKSINYQKRGIKIKEEIDALVQAILTEKRICHKAQVPEKLNSLILISKTKI
ncbi:MAG: hypothetical protein LUH15_01825 [Tannerellaceae bacterium]|nr:hypothetical protein [Tannerellaceae bacterium]